MFQNLPGLPPQTPTVGGATFACIFPVLPMLSDPPDVMYWHCVCTAMRPFTRIL